MGCVASRLEEEEEVVAICRERKRQLKLAVERRYALADAHYRYCQSLYGVSAAIRLFVARHSNPPSPFMITLPPPIIPQPPPPPLLSSAAAAGLPPPLPQQDNVVVSNPLFLQQTPSQPTKATTTATTPVHHCESGQSSASEDSDSSDEEVEVGKLQAEPSSSSEYFYMEMMSSHQSVMMPSPHRDFGAWDFFNPFFTSVRPEMIVNNGGYNGNNRVLSEEEENLRAVREQEGIPELEEDEEEKEMRGRDSVKMAAQKYNAEQQQQSNEYEQNSKGVVVEVDECANQRGGEEVSQKGLTVIDTPEGGGRELLEALGDVGDHFIRAYDSGKDLSRMLEVNRVQLQSNLEEIKESSRKKIQAITLRSTSSRSSSCKSLVASSSSKGALTTWSSEFKNDLFDDYGGMDSGSHSLTLGRIYAWEKKLYEEVKAGDNIRKIYERKCSQLRHQDVRGAEGVTVDKTRAAVKDLYSRILVAIRSAETISQRIEKLRDEELQPQIMELLHGMIRCWQVMLESHEIQNKIMYEVKTFTCPTYGKFCNESHRLSTLQLEAELQNWRTCFKEYIASLKLYVEALYGWISKFIVPEEVELHSKIRSRNYSLPPDHYQLNGPPLLMLCRDWLAAMDKLPDKAVSSAIRNCERDVKALWVQQGKEQQQKRRVDNLSKELDTKTLAFQKAENRMYEFRLTDKPDSEMEAEDHKTEHLNERKDLLENFRRRVELEKEHHQNCMQETQRITLNGFQTGFSRVFESMTEFSKTTLQMYNDLVSSKNNDGKFQNESSYSHGSQLEVGKKGDHDHS